MGLNAPKIEDPFARRGNKGEDAVAAAAKRISQETFNEVVKENIEDLEMEPEEAVSDAVQQFEAQGVDLSNIVKGVPKEDGTVDHPVVNATQAVVKAVESDDRDALAAALADVKSQCQDAETRAVAGANGGIKAILDALNLVKGDSDGSVLAAAADACVAILKDSDDNKDAIRKHMGPYIIGASLKDRGQGDGSVAQRILNLAKIACIKNEENRQRINDEGIIDSTLKILKGKKDHGPSTREACRLLRVLTFDDDMRATFGLAHERAKEIVEEGGIKEILESMKARDERDESESDKCMTDSELLSTLSRMAIKDEFCTDIVDLGGLAMVLDNFGRSANHAAVCKHSAAVLKALAGNDDIKVTIAEGRGLTLILDAMTTHVRDAGVQENCCAAIAAVALRHPQNAAKFAQAGGIDKLVAVMKVHASQVRVQRQALLAVRNLVSRNKDLVTPLVDEGIEELIHEAMKLHESTHDYARSALRDLGLKVQLAEMWKGEGKILEQGDLHSENPHVNDVYHEMRKQVHEGVTGEQMNQFQEDVAKPLKDCIEEE